jgi:hypothetical protein
MLETTSKMEVAKAQAEAANSPNVTMIGTRATAPANLVGASVQEIGDDIDLSELAPRGGTTRVIACIALMVAVLVVAVIPSRRDVRSELGIEGVSTYGRFGCLKAKA